MDLDGFKEVNDSLGHQAGDDLLRQIKPRLAEILRESDTLARLGGDEFAVILSPINSIAHGLEIVDSIVDRMNEPFDVGHHVPVRFEVTSTNSARFSGAGRSV